MSNKLNTPSVGFHRGLSSVRVIKTNSAESATLMAS